MPELLENKYIYWLITGAIALLGSAVIFFLKRELNKLDSRQKEQDNRINDVEDKLNKTISELPFLYTLREDHIRSMASHDRKLDQIISLLMKGGNQNG